jgi:flagellar basal-body rod protein FlgC
MAHLLRISVGVESGIYSGFRAMYTLKGDYPHMDYLSTAGKISADGMSVQRKRLEVHISNLVNSNTTQVAGKEPISRKDVVFTAASPTSENFKKAMDAAMEEVQSVAVSRVVADTSEPIKRYEPNHPHADKDGYVLYPNINSMEELVNIVSATRSYEANLQARKSTGAMKDSALAMLK